MREHEFHDSLRKAEDGRNEPFWRECYERAFPDMVSLHLNNRNNGAQRSGIDRLIILRSTKTIRIDDKYRDESYKDILLEDLGYLDEEEVF